jgi:hypothetical protein
MIAVAKAQVRQFNLVAVVTTFVGVTLMVVSTAVWNLGAVGVTLAMLVVTIVTHLVYFWPLLIRLAGTSPRAFVTETLIPGLTPALASGAVWVGLQAAYPVESWMTLLFHVTVGAIVYLGALLAFCLRASDRDMLRALVLKVKPLRNRP